ncbi:MAG: ATP-binding protein [Campylobacterota bacterium]|nr:ATP-binding protein [Campylobacterota bacterium]
MFDVDRGEKLQDLHIVEYKLFQDFKISFSDKNSNPLPLIIIAGVNGTGKTTILEFIKSEIAHNSIYFPAQYSLNDIKEFMPKYIEKMVYEEDIVASKIYKRVRNYINSILDGFDMKIVFDSRDGEGNLFFRNKRGDKLSIDDISTGEKTLLSKVLYLYFKDIRNQIVLIDEPELSLHPSWQNKILKLYETFAKENNCQIIIATHSPHIIGSAKNEWIRLLAMNENDEVEVINDVLAYGRDIEWVLEEVMGIQYTREESVSKKIKECQELLNDDKYDEAEICIDTLEKVIGENDSEVLAMRNDIAFWRD